MQGSSGNSKLILVWNDPSPAKLIRDKTQWHGYNRRDTRFEERTQAYNYARLKNRFTYYPRDPIRLTVSPTLSEKKDTKPKTKKRRKREGETKVIVALDLRQRDSRARERKRGYLLEISITRMSVHLIIPVTRPIPIPKVLRLNYKRIGGLNRRRHVDGLICRLYSSVPGACYASPRNAFLLRWLL